jgi:thiamine biosynthesis lipoprotein
MDLSGIAKGKIVDLIRDQLFHSGFSDFLIDAGGDLYVSGKNLNRKYWRIAIQDPEHEDKFSGVLEKTDTAIVTSGDYENFFVQNEKRYSHLFNPNTGYPDSDCKSVTIITDDTAKGDAIATAVFAMGSSRGYRFLLDKGIEGFIIFRSGKHDIESLSTPHFWD